MEELKVKVVEVSQEKEQPLLEELHWYEQGNHRQ